MIDESSAIQSARRWLVNGLFAVVLFSAQSAIAHGLLISVRGDESSVSGRVYYSSGEPGAGEWVQLFDLTTPSAQPLGINADSEGNFRFVGSNGHRYRISVTGEEGHAVDSEITLSADARGRFVEREDAGAAAARPFWPPPAWAVIGGVLVLSLIPAFWMRLRRRGSRKQAG